MDFRTFQANTMSAALAEVKHEMGPAAVILHTRSFYKNRWLGLRKREIFEITASRETARRLARFRNRRSARLQCPSQVKPLGIPRGQLLASSASQNAAMLGLMQEVTGLKGMVKELVIQSSRMRTPEIPEELFDFYSRLIQNQVAEELAGDMIRTLQKQIRPEHARQPDFVRMKLAEQIEKLLPSAGPIIRTKTAGPHVVALIGPTGVGKTTTIAKLAANLQLREKRRVGLITLDTYRIAAIDQLQEICRHHRLASDVVGTAENSLPPSASMSDCEFILIDTAGRSPNDALKLSELKGTARRRQAG